MSNAIQLADMLNRLGELGISRPDAIDLRRISMTLHRWHELECGDGNDYGSWCIVRGQLQNDAFVYDDAGLPHLERHWHQGPGRSGPSYDRVPDRERGALDRLARIMKGYPDLVPYVQGDPRGCALYVLRKADIREG